MLTFRGGCDIIKGGGAQKFAVGAK